MQSIWESLQTPFLVMAPMEAVTDSVYRQIIASAAPPEVFFTEFTSCEGLLSKGGDIVGRRLQYTTGEKPLIAQIWSGNPNSFEKAARLVSEMGFDGIDINMGCPDKSVIRSNAGSGLIKDVARAKSIIDGTNQGANGLPVSVKTRLGFYNSQMEDWIGEILSVKPAALTIHMRTTKDLSLVPAKWEEMPFIVSLRDQISPSTKIIGNGDVLSREQGNELARKYLIDGIMIGRGIFQNLWAFHHDPLFQATPKMYLEKLLDHTLLFERTWGNTKNFAILKKFYKAYVKDFSHASELRIRLMDTNTTEEVATILKSFLHQMEL